MFIRSKIRQIYRAVFFSLLFIPTFVLAAPQNFKQLVNIFIDIISKAIPVVIGLAILYFFWGLTKYIFAQGNETAKVDGKKIMIWGLVGIFFMFSIAGIILFFGGILPDFPGTWSQPMDRGPVPGVPFDYPNSGS